MLIVVWTSGTSTMLPLILSCPTLRLAWAFQMVVKELVVYTLTHLDKKNAGFSGNCMPLTTAQGRTLFLDKY